MVIYVWPTGQWMYDWEMKGFLLQHQTIPSGGRWVDLDNLWNVQPQLSREEQEAVKEALGE